MMLAIRTDKPEAELYFVEEKKVIYEHIWQAHRELSDTLLQKVEEGLSSNKLTKSDIEGIVYFAGPGSFTGLRIGAAYVNSLAWALHVPVVSSSGDDWLKEGVSNLKTAPATMVVPHYGSEAHITQPRK